MNKGLIIKATEKIIN